MREIEYRAFDDGQMLYGDCIKYEEDTSYVERLSKFFGILREDAILMEYIDKRDKNNKKIYEKDIVICRRYWDNPTDYMVIIEDIRNLPQELFGSELIEREIIGNVYENPELLNECK